MNTRESYGVTGSWRRRRRRSKCMYGWNRNLGIQVDQEKNVSRWKTRPVKEEEFFELKEPMKHTMFVERFLVLEIRAFLYRPSFSALVSNFYCPFSDKILTKHLNNNMKSNYLCPYIFPKLYFFIIIKLFI